MVDFRDIGNVLMNTQTPEVQGLTGFNRFTKTVNDMIQAEAERKANEQLAKDKADAAKLKQMLDEADLIEKIQKGQGVRGASARNVIPGAEVTPELKARGIEGNLGQPFPGVTNTEAPMSTPNSLNLPQSNIIPTSDMSLGVQTPELTSPQIPTRDIMTGVQLPEIQKAQTTKLPPQTTAIDILAYDPLDPTKIKKVGSFQGRLGMSPKMIPINNQVTEGQAATIASQDVAIGNLHNLRDIVARGNIGDKGQLAAQYIGNPTGLAFAVNALEKLGLVTPEQAYDIQDYNAELNSAKQNIAVSRGGKQLTLTELQLITGTLPRAIQNPELWDNIIKRYEDEFNKNRETMKGGKSSVQPIKSESTNKSTGGIQGLSKEGFQNFLKGKK